MRATTDTLDVLEPLQTTEDARGTSRSTFAGASALKGGVRSKPQEKWSSSLAPDDLRCLLAVLETRLIPALLQGYAPTTMTPLPSADGDH